VRGKPTNIKNITGWAAVLISVFSLAPSIAPGGVSLFGLLISLFALVLSVFSVKRGRKGYFIATLVIVILGILVANDTFRLWGALPGVSLKFKLSAYGVSFLIIVGCMLGAKKFFSRMAK